VPFPASTVSSTATPACCCWKTEHRRRVGAGRPETAMLLGRDCLPLSPLGTQRSRRQAEAIAILRRAATYVQRRTYCRNHGGLLPLLQTPAANCHNHPRLRDRTCHATVAGGAAYRADARRWRSASQPRPGLRHHAARRLHPRRPRLDWSANGSRRQRWRAPARRLISAPAATRQRRPHLAHFRSQRLHWRRQRCTGKPFGAGQPAER